MKNSGACAILQPNYEPPLIFTITSCICVKFPPACKKEVKLHSGIDSNCRVYLLNGKYIWTLLDTEKVVYYSCHIHTH